MPQVQVLSRQADPAASRISSAGQAIADTVMKKQAMELTKRELEIRAKNTQNEAERLRFERLKQIPDIMVKVQEGQMPPEIAVKIMDRHLKAAGLTFADLGEVGETFSKILQDLAPQDRTASQGELRSAQIGRLKSESSVLNRFLAGSQEGASAATGTQPTGISTSNPRANAVSDGMMLKSANVGGFQFTNPSAIAQEERSRKTAQQQVPALTADMRNSLVETRQQMANIDYMEGLARDLPSGPLYGGVSSIAAQLTGGFANPSLKVYNDQLPGFAVGFYRAVTGDKRTSDRDAGERAFPFLWRPGEVAAVRSRKYAAMKRMLKAREDMILSGAATLNTETGLYETPLTSVMRTAGVDAADLTEARPLQGPSTKPAKTMGRKIGKYTVWED